MKSLKSKLLSALFFAGAFCSLGQSASAPQAFWVHEDLVKPSKVAEYEAACKELISNLKKHNIQDANFLATNLDDNRYLYVGPISKMADLDQSIFATLGEKMGKDQMNAIFSKMDQCYDIERDYILYLDNELSYMPEGITQTPEGQNYRTFHFLHVSPGNRAMAKEKVKAVKDLFAKKGSKEYYRVYRSGFGAPNEYYMVAVAAKDAAHQAALADENTKLLGEEGEKVFGELFANLIKYEKFTGRMRPDLYYKPQ